MTYLANRLLQVSRAGLLILAAVASLHTQADSLQQIEKERLKIQATLQQHKERVAYLNDRIERTREDLQDAEQALAKQESKLGEAINNAEQNPGDVSARAATHASIRYNRSEARSERLKERLDSAVEELASIEQHKLELNQQLAALAQRETALKASLAAAASAKTSATSAPIPAPAAPVKAEVAVSTPALVAEAPEPTTATWPSPEDESAANVAFARETLAAAAAQPTGKPPLPSVKLNHNRGRGTETLDYLGNNLYAVTLQLEAGMWGFKLFNQTYWVSIPKDKADQSYRLIYDVNGRAELHVIRAELLN